MDQIFLSGMSFYGYHGAMPEENVLGQKFILDVTLGLDTTEAGETDLLEKTVNYAEVYEICRKYAEDETYQLVERLAHLIATDILDKYIQCDWIKVRVTKPNPPIAGNYNGVGVEVLRDRGSL